mgnify:CR=1 FL=1
MYSTYVSFVLGCMIITGAARSIIAKLFFQVGFDHPLFLTLLYLGGALSLVPYNLWVYFCACDDDDEENDDDENRCNSVEKEISSSAIAIDTTTTRSQRLGQSVRRSSYIFAQSIFTVSQQSSSDDGQSSQRRQRRHSTQAIINVGGRTTGGEICNNIQVSNRNRRASAPVIHSELRMAQVDSNAIIIEEEKVEEGECDIEEEEAQECNPHTKNHHSTNQTKPPQRKSHMSSLSKSVSVHGLPSESKTKNCISKIPWYLKPVLPAFFNLLNSCMRWTSLLFVAASIAEMLISGMELVLSVVAARCVRGRRITWVRWVGVGIVTIGITLVGIFDTRNANNIASNGDDSANTNSQDSTAMRDQVIGILLILGQSIMSVFQDIAEEVFMHEADFPPALLVGMEGSFGLIVALILYFPLAPLFDEQPSTVLEDLQNNSEIIGLSIGWGLLVTVTGVFNIAATGVTSSMTRNVWKNFRTALIWIVSLVIFYATGNPELGEEWFIPGSFYILIGFAVMLIGVYVYYGKGAKT